MEETLIALVALTGVFIYWGNNINEEHALLKTLTRYTAIWLMYGCMGAIQKYVTLDAVASDLADLMSTLMYAYGVFVVFVTLYMILMPMFAWFSNWNGKKEEEDA
jgi:TRAP-type C4-dicarboxylate transport system permease large subunit